MKLGLVSLLLVSSANAFVINPAFMPAVKAPMAETSTALEAAGLGNDLKGKRVPSTMFSQPTKKAVASKTKKGYTQLEPSYSLAYACSLIAPFIYYLNTVDGVTSDSGLYGAVFHLALAGWVGAQASRVRAVFEKDAIEFYNLKGTGTKFTARPADDPNLERKPDNWLVKTANRWKYKTITGYQFYPSLDVPVLTILWETETAEGKSAYGEQPHFFPVLFNARLFKEEMDKKGVPYK